MEKRAVCRAYSELGAREALSRQRLGRVRNHFYLTKIGGDQISWKRVPQPGQDNGTA